MYIHIDLEKKNDHICNGIIIMEILLFVCAHIYIYITELKCKDKLRNNSCYNQSNIIWQRYKKKYHNRIKNKIEKSSERSAIK